MWKILVFAVVLLITVPDTEAWLFHHVTHVHHHHHHHHYHGHHHHHGWWHHGRRSLNNRRKSIDENDKVENDERKLME